jgi:hypothetical protein
LTAFGDFCQGLVILERIRIDGSSCIQGFALSHDIVRPVREQRILVLKKLERLTILVGGRR